MAEYLTVTGAARKAHIDRNTISYHIKFGNIKAIKRGPKIGWLIEESELDRWLKARSEQLQGVANGKK